MTTYQDDTDRLRQRWPSATAGELAESRTVLEQIEAVMSDGQWWHPHMVFVQIGRASQEAKTARIRELRNRGWIVESKRREGRSDFVYRIVGKTAPTSTPRTTTAGHCDSCTCRVVQETQSAMFMGETQ